MKNKVVLFFPETHLHRKEDAWCLPPFSLLAIAGPLVQSGVEVVIVDARLRPDFLDTIILESGDAICLGISVLTGNQIRQALLVSRAVKERFPSLPVVWGGYHPTLMPDQTIAQPCVDVVVRGQGETTFSSLVRAFQNGASLREIPGLSYKAPGRIICNEDAPFLDINQFPSMPFGLVDMDRHLPDLGFARRTMSYVSSQGCPHHCEFCAESTAYKVRWSGQSASRVVHELKALLSRHACDGVIFVDNNFFVNESRVQEICREILRQDLHFRWAAQGRADRIATLSDKTFALLKASGFSVFHVGAESGSDDQLELVSKHSTRQTTLDCALTVRRHDLHISFGFIFGFPGETPKDLQQNFSLMKAVTDIQGSYDCIYHFYAPSPGSPLMESSLQHGAPAWSNLEDWIGYNTTRGVTPWVTPSYIDQIRRRTDYYFPFARPNFMLRSRLTRSRLRRIAFYPLHLLNRLRYRFDFYAVPVDWWLFRTLRGFL